MSRSLKEQPKKAAQRLSVNKVTSPAPALVRRQVLICQDGGLRGTKRKERAKNHRIWTEEGIVEFYCFHLSKSREGLPTFLPSLPSLLERIKTFGVPKHWKDLSSCPTLCGDMYMYVYVSVYMISISLSSVIIHPPIHPSIYIKNCSCQVVLQ